jgi:flagellar protein FliO/FliZ
MSSSAPGPGLSSLLWFIAILVLIPVALWLFKRSPAGARFGGGTGQGAMRTVSSLSLSPNQRVVTVEVGQGDERRWLVLGVTSASINTLHSMAPQGETPVAANSAAPAFAQLLAGLRRDKGADGAV